MTLIDGQLFYLYCDCVTLSISFFARHSLPVLPASHLCIHAMSMYYSLLSLYRVVAVLLGLVSVQSLCRWSCNGVEVDCGEIVLVLQAER